MKTISILVILAIFGSIIAPDSPPPDAEANAIIGITVPDTKTAEVGPVSITFTVSNGKIVVDDIIILSKTDTSGSSDPKATVGSFSGASLTAEFTFITGGEYKVFVQKKGSANAILQDTEGLFMTIIPHAEADAISAITVPATKTGKVGPVSITFTVDNSKLANDDIIILSTTDPVQANDPKATVSGLSGTSFNKEFTFNTGGKYKVFVQKKDTSKAILQSASGLLMTIAGPTAITAITSPSNQKGKVGKVSITFAVDNTQLDNGDTIIMSTTTGPDTDPKTDVSALSGSSYTAEFTFPLAGEYKVFVKKTNSSAKQQGNVKITITDPGSDLVTKVEATDPKANVATIFKFTLKAGGLLKDDKLYLSTSKTDTVGSDDKSVLLDKDENGPTLEKEFTLASAGSYSVFITRGVETTKQIADAITVASSGFVSMALALGLVFLLF